MQYYYGDKSMLKALDEAEFWKHQEAEHTEVIQAVTPDLEKEYAVTLKEYGVSFRYANGEAAKYIETVIRSEDDYSDELKSEMLRFIRQCIRQSKEFIGFLEFLIENSDGVKNNNTSRVVIFHIIRESQYFIGIEQIMSGMFG